MAHSATSTLPDDTEIDAMARVLARRYGGGAEKVAALFLAEHLAAGDRVRAGLRGEVHARLTAPAAPTLS